ncbi:hypothetical protein [Streptomyces goshikiensis]|uniref:hypothetical protein n=1 Tax=Streptomyces goshikiensis TaxID=1942 RepID=UPI0036BD099B
MLTYLTVHQSHEKAPSREVHPRASPSIFAVCFQYPVSFAANQPTVEPAGIWAAVGTDTEGNDPHHATIRVTLDTSPI